MVWGGRYGGHGHEALWSESQRVCGIGACTEMGLSAYEKQSLEGNHSDRFLFICWPAAGIKRLGKCVYERRESLKKQRDAYEKQDFVASGQAWDFIRGGIPGRRHIRVS